MNTPRNILQHLLVLCTLFFIIAGCSDQPSGKSAMTPEVIRIAPLPDQSAETLQRLYDQ